MIFLENPLQEIMPLADCQKCFDSGIWLNAQKVERCPNIKLGNHPAENPSSVIFNRAARRLNDLKGWINPRCFELARILTHYDSKNPCSRDALFQCFFEDSEVWSKRNLRLFHGWIEELRKFWLMPIGSRKDAPCGYWIITDLNDFKRWVERATSAPITQLNTIHKVAKHNFPHYAEQLELDFWKDFGDDNGKK